MTAWQALRWTIVGYAISVVGSLLNEFVMWVNGGLMPVFETTCDGFSGWQLDYRHACASGATKLAGLTDWIHVPGFVISPGDILILGGMFVVVAMAGVFAWRASRALGQKLRRVWKSN